MSVGFGILIVGHGDLANQYLATLVHVIGALERIEAIPIYDRDDRAQKTAEIIEAVQRLDNGEGVVIITDMMGSSPSNMAQEAFEHAEVRIMYGANMPSIVKLAKMRHVFIDDALQAAVETGRKYLNFCTEGRKIGK